MNKTQLELLVHKLTKENRALEDNVIRLFKNVSTLEKTISTLEYDNNHSTSIKNKLKDLCNEKSITISTLSNNYKHVTNELFKLKTNHNNLQDEYEDSLLQIELLNKELQTLQDNDLDNLYLASLDEQQSLNLTILKLKKKIRKLKK